ncbi:hypothetical protein CMMCAS07_20145 [Clavibacter michiganensis subsp. michiganensis]|uniref:Uncharacterized protein n=1 Tax=Clavibacter michiganensis subsp. michiganensis TaxID=33013 RepID=A0A251XCI3_CLAMM|nr:hypothetical protein CMMCAS07_20145 [Clavibacter michiganensis subsp. michiganensis]
MRDRHHGRERLGEELHEVDAVGRIRVPHDRDVELAPLQRLHQVGREALAHPHLDIRVVRAEPPDALHGSGPLRGDRDGRVHHADLEPPGVPAGDARHLVEPGLCLPQHRPSALPQRRARRSDGDAPGGADEQRHAEPALEALHLLGQHRLRDAELLGGPAEVPLVGDGEEGADEAEVEIHSRKLSERCLSYWTRLAAAGKLDP